MKPESVVHVMGSHCLFLCVCLVSKFLLPGGRGEEKKGREAGRRERQVTQFVAKGRWKAFLP